MRLIRRSRGQTTLEYAVLVAVIVAAAVGIQNYLRRGIQGRVRDASDRLGSQWDAGASHSTVATRVNTTSNEALTNQGQSTSTQALTQRVDRTEDVTSSVTGNLP